MTGVYDLVIVGLGAAGLNAVDTLRRGARGKKLRWCAFEARDRLGGRILTGHSPRSAGPFRFPVEYGAEFVHGMLPHTMQLARELGLPWVEPAEVHGGLAGRHIVAPPNFFARVERELHQLLRPRRGHPVPRELSFAQATAHARRISPELRSYVEGFYGADPARLSARELLAGEDEAGEDRVNGRLLGGYGDLIEGLRRRNPQLATHAHLQHELLSVRAIKVRAGARPLWELEFRAPSRQKILVRTRQLLLTLPLGVIQARAPQLFPQGMPPELRAAMAGLAFGHARRIVFEFRQNFWRERFARAGARQGPVTYVHSPHLNFPTWWTAEPVQAPFITAWVGGPRAKNYAGASTQQLRRAGLQDLARMLNRPLRSIAREFCDLYTHDWDADPFSGGAYSYAAAVEPGAPGQTEPKHTVKAFKGQWVLAGEAWSAEGTVEAALSSGAAAATHFLKRPS